MCVCERERERERETQRERERWTKLPYYKANRHYKANRYYVFLKNKHLEENEFFYHIKLTLTLHFKKLLLLVVTALFSEKNQRC